MTTTVRNQRAGGGATSAYLDNDELTAGHTNSIVGLVDPFSSAARGVRLPDLGSSRTVTEAIRVLGTVSTNASGSACMFFQASPKWSQLSSTSVAGSDFTMAAAFTATATNSTKLQKNARIITWGVRFVNTQSATNSTGSINLIKTNRVVPSGVYTAAPSLYPVFETHPLKHGGEWTINSHPTGNDRAEWVDFAATVNTDVVQSSFEGIGIMVLGSTASSAILAFELFMNTEYIVDDDDPLTMYALPQPVYNPQLLQAVNAVHTAHDGTSNGKEGFTKEIKGLAVSSAKKHLLPFLKKQGLKGLMAL
jgi:hypothetical protein